MTSYTLWKNGLRWTVALLIAGLLTAGAFAQDAAPDDEAAAEIKDMPKDLAGQWENMLHFINIARPKLANAYGQAILDNPDAQPKDLYMLSVKQPQSLRTLQRALKQQQTRAMALKLQQRIEEGYKAWRSDPEQIEHSIAMLGEGLRAYVLAKQRLQESGVYAIPLMIQTLRDESASEIVRQRIITLLGDMGKEAVRPYSMVLSSPDLKLVGFIANALGQIQYPSAVPRLREALTREDLQNPTNPTRKVIEQAILQCSSGNTAALTKPLSELFFALGTRYYQRADSLMPAPADPALVWFWDDQLGLVRKDVPAEIFADVYAMRMARLSLKYDAGYYPAVPLWLSAAIRRQIDLPDGATDPLWTADAPQADYYALASSPRYLQMVLQQALNDTNVAIAKITIETMGKTTGASALTRPLTGGAQPLVSAMGYPDRALRYLAAETLALALPRKPFVGHPMVLMILNDALRQQVRKTAMVIVRDDEKRNTILDAVRTAGYEVIQVDVPGDAIGQALAAPAVDVVFVGAGTSPDSVIGSFRRETVFQYLPVVIHQAGPAASRLAEQDGRVVVLASDQDNAESIGKALEQAISLTAGAPLDEQQARQWTLRAARAVQAVAECESIVYDVKRSVDALISVLQRDDSELVAAAAGALANIRSARAQQALIDLALRAETPLDTRVMAFNAASQSVRRFGNEATNAQAQAVVQTVTGEGENDLLNAAARLLGTMNLPSEQTPELILGADEMD